MITFNDQAETAITGLSVKDIMRPALPEIKNTFGGGSGIIGSYDFGAKWGGRTISVLFQAKAATQTALQDLIINFSAWLSPLTVKPLKFDDEPGRVYYARVINADDIKQLYVYGECTIKFYCPDPYKYAATPKSVNFVSNAAAPNNVGKVSVLPKFTITFTAAASEIKIINGSKFVRVVDTFAIGNTLTIDHKTGAILKNGVRNVLKLDWQNSEFFDLAPGVNNLSVTPIDVATISVEFTEGWL